LIVSAPTATAQTTSTPTASSGATAASASATQADAESRLKSVEREVKDFRDNAYFILIPITVLIGILALGGSLGVVFSIRDQRRISQLHELSVGSEISAQRRSDQSYSFFLEESQKTLTLVNDTLELAREATDRAAHTMELKAESNLARIEERAQSLLLPLLGKAQFEGIFDDLGQAHGA